SFRAAPAADAVRCPPEAERSRASGGWASRCCLRFGAGAALRARAEEVEGVLIECPDCGRKISDRAKEGPDCACPVAEVMAERRAEQARAESKKSRRSLEREVDCPNCEARGFYKCDDGYAEWCVPCEHTGRLILCAASDGYYGVAAYAVERFLSGEL